MIPIFHAGGQGWKVRFISLLSLVSAALLLWLGDALRTDPKSSPAEKVIVGALLLVVAIGLPLGMWIYGRCYVLSAAADEAGQRVRVTVAGLLFPSTREMPVEDLAEARFHAGRMETHEHRVDAPWHSIAVRGRWLPLLLDAQGRFLDEARVRTILLGEGASARRTRKRGRG